MIVKTKLGEIKGKSENGVAKYFGIPYAEAPVGDLRFKKPVPKKAWDECLNADDFSTKCPQLSIPVQPDNGIPQSEDCLYLNIWAPDNNNEKKPVFFWIFGGGLSAGEGSTDTYDGSEFAKNGDVIVVTFNYRVGIFGGFFNFAALPGMEGKYEVNTGMYDILEALKWVNENIEAFGGDKDNITLCGESAGASLAALLLYWPEAEGLFAKAALESTFNYGVTPAADTKLAEKILSCAGLSAENASDFLNLSTEEILKALSDSCGGNVLACGAGFQENEVFSGTLQTMLQKGFADVPILIGYNHDEGNIFANPQAPDFAEQAVQMTRFLFESVIDAVLAAENRSSKTFIYRYDYIPAPLKAQGMGALHSAEMPCVFHTLTSSMGGALMADAEASETVSMAMHKNWISFLQNGAPNWNAFSADSPSYMKFDVESVECNDSWRV